MKNASDTDHFKFLDRLRASGVTNMYGAGPYLAAEFGMDRGKARGIVLCWMATYDPDLTPAQRIAKSEGKTS